MGMKLFDDEVQNADVSKIEIDKEFARRYEHNKKREALQRFEELKKKGQIEESDSLSDSQSSDEEDDADLIKLTTKEHLQKLFENLNKVKKRDPSLYSENGKFFESDSGSDSDSDGDRKEKIEIRDSNKKPKYLKDVTAQQLLEEGPEFEDGESSKKKTYNEEQEELKKAFLDAVKDAEEDGEGDLLKMKEKKNGNEEEEEEEDDGRGEFEKKLGEYFGPEGGLDENNKFLKEFFEKRMWVDKGTKDRSSFVDDDEMDELLRDEEEIEKQEKYEESYNFRYEENAGDRVMGHSRKVEGSVRKKENARKEQRKSKEERMRIAERERKEELKHLKNLKKKEMKERMMKVMEAAGISDDNDFALDLEEDFDPAEYDKMMKKAFGEKYYNADDMDPEFGSDNDGADIVKPDFDKEDELLGLPKGWDAVENQDGFLAARERFLKQKAENGGEEEEEEEKEEDEEEEEEEGREEMGNAVEQNEESKRKRKRKMSLVKKVKEEMMEEYYKLDYEGTIGDLKTRFKYAGVNPNRYGLKTEEILMLDDKELNQYVSVKKLVPYREREWKVPNNKRFQYKTSIRELLRGRLNNSKSSKKNRSEDYGVKSTSVVGSHQDGKAELEGSNAEMDKLSRQAKRRRRQKELKLSQSRLAAYQNIQPRAKGKGKH